MRNTSQFGIFFLAIVMMMAPAFGQDLMPGSKAPKLEVKEFLKGEPVKQLEKGKVYVIECWATWCGPCIKSIPHLSELQKKHKEVTIIGIAVMQEDPEEVTAFVEKMGDKMAYRVALDKPGEGDDVDEGATVANWLEASGQQGIPAAFIVSKDGLIAWMGHPSEMDEPLEKIVAGKWNIAEEAERARRIKEAEKQKQQLIAKLQQLFQKFSQTGESAPLLAALDDAAKQLPDEKIQFEMLKFQVLASPEGDVDKALKLAKQLIEREDVATDVESLNFIAWTIVSPEREKKADAKLTKLALDVALKADNLTKQKDPSVGDTVAKAYFDNGQLEKAVEIQERVIESAKGTQMEQDPSLKKRLRQYRRALELSNGGTESKDVDVKKE